MIDDLFENAGSPLSETTALSAFSPSRKAGLARLADFAPRSGRRYATQRNYDFGPDKRWNVSALSPWIRRRLVTEEDVLTAILARQTPASADKFIQEVFWRAYFKGWLEQHPSVWRSYQAGLAHALGDLDADPDLAARYHDALDGRTGVDCFDAWAQELVETGYLHNHARMWFASIWIFTLRLPWELGADFFLRHLLDGDPASNTLSWRWVGGLHTKGKTYLARPDNIAKYTDGRFSPQGLAPFAEALVEPEDHVRRPLPEAARAPEGDVLLLITEEDCRIAEIMPRPAAATLGISAAANDAPPPVGASARDFAIGAVTEAAGAVRIAEDWAETIISAAKTEGVSDVVTGYAPVGAVADRLNGAQAKLASEGVRLHQIRRDYDMFAWPHATKGFFALKQKIPQILKKLKLTA